MSTVKVVAYAVAAILLLFGVLYLLSAFSADAASPVGRLLVGAVLVALGLGIVVAVRLREPKPAQAVTIQQKIDLSGDVQMEAMKCTSCGGQLDKSAVSVIQGAVMVNCPYCGATYQLTEEPKW